MNREQENYFQLREHQDNTYYGECYFHKDSSSLAGEEGHFGAHTLASATLWLVGHKASVEGLRAASGAEQIGGVTHYRQASLWEYPRGLPRLW